MERKSEIYAQNSGAVDARCVDISSGFWGIVVVADRALGNSHFRSRSQLPRKNSCDSLVRAGTMANVNKMSLAMFKSPDYTTFRDRSPLDIPPLDDRPSDDLGLAAGEQPLRSAGRDGAPCTAAGPRRCDEHRTRALPKSVPGKG